MGSQLSVADRVGEGEREEESFPSAFAGEQ